MKIEIYKTIILAVILYECETWSLIWREEYRLTVSENRVLRKMFGPQRDKATGEWRRLHNEELCASPNIIWVIKSRRTRWPGHVACMRKTGELHTRFWWKNLMERDHLVEPGIDVRLV